MKRPESGANAGWRHSAQRDALWCYVIGAACLGALSFVFASSHLGLWTALGLSSAVATVVGIRRHRPGVPTGWYLLAAAEFSAITGDTTYNVLTRVSHQDGPFPSIADLFHLLTYPLLAAGLFLLVRGRSSIRDGAARLDAVIVTTGLGLLSWVYLAVPAFQSDGLTGSARFVSVGYPLGDVLVLAVLVRLVGDGGLRIRSMQLLVLGASAVVVADVLYGLMQLHGDSAVGGPVDIGWVVFYVAGGAAALHPSMTRVSETVPRRVAGTSGVRVVLLAEVSLVAPVVLLIESVAGATVHARTIALFSAALFLLVIARLWGILRGHQQSLDRERILRSSSEALVAAPGLSDIYQVALDGVRALTGDPARTSAAIYLAHGDETRCVARSRTPTHPAEPTDPSRYWPAATAGGTLNAAGTVSVSPLGHDPAERGMLVVRRGTPLTLDQHGAISTLAAQVALAAESAHLAEDLRDHRSEERLRGMLQHTSDIIVIVNSGGEIVYSTPSLGRHLGFSPAEVYGRNLARFVDPADVAEVVAMFAGAATTPAPAVADWRLRRKDGSLIAFEVLANNLLGDPRVGGVVLTMRDVSERRALEEQLKHQAFHDTLTGLANRALFRDRADHALARTARSATMVAMVMLDLDDFKIVNDTRGHAAGDELLVQVASRVQATLRRDATVSRFGGDEFAILVEDLTDVAQALAFADRVLTPFETPFTIDGVELTVRASIGLAVAGGITESMDTTELMRCADLALYEAKERGKHQVALYHRDLHVRMVDRLTRRSDLETALAAGEFAVVYQPVVAIATGQVMGIEALVRWRHPTRGQVPPLDFIELAEETGMIVELGDWVLDQACAQMRAWMGGGHTGMNISVNVSAVQLREPRYVDRVRAALRRHRVPPGQLMLELTESIFAADVASTAATLQSLRDVGVKIAMDDFGTGYSSLSYLQKFQLDILKIDKSFVDGLGTGDVDAIALVTAIVSMAHSLHLDVVAEGIEHLAQRDELRDVGCVYGQGHLFARPLEAAQVSAQLSRSRFLEPDRPATAEPGPARGA